MTKDKLLTHAREPNGLILTFKSKDKKGSSDQMWTNANKLLAEGKIRMAERFHDGSGYRMVST